MNTIKFALLMIAVLMLAHACGTVAYGQQVCISQAAANTCAANTRELMAVRDENAVLKTAIEEQKKVIADLKETNRQNVADLTAQNTRLLTDNARLIGENTELKADKVFWAEIIKVAMANTRKKCNGLVLFC